MIHLSKAEIQHEEEHWSQVFENELAYPQQKRFSSYWWEDYYGQIKSLFHRVLENETNISILEPGCGSAKASYILAGEKKWPLTLVDISQSALDYAKHLAATWYVEDARYVKADIFDMPVEDGAYTLVWNLGVIEHYSPESIVALMAQMVRKTKVGGYVAIGYPNFFSGPILKAKLLTYWPFKLLKGYRLDSEKFYSRRQIVKYLHEAAKAEQRIISNIQISTVGNPLPMETPSYLLNTIGVALNAFLLRSRFLTFVIIRMDKK